MAWAATRDRAGGHRALLIASKRTIEPSLDRFVRHAEHLPDLDLRHSLDAHEVEDFPLLAVPRRLFRVVPVACSGARPASGSAVE